MRCHKWYNHDTLVLQEKEKAWAQKQEVVSQMTEVLESELQCIICSELFIEVTPYFLEGLPAAALLGIQSADTSNTSALEGPAVVLFCRICNLTCLC